MLAAFAVINQEAIKVSLFQQVIFTAYQIMQQVNIPV